MTLYEFNALDEREQMEAIYDKAVFLAKREDEEHSYELVQIDGFNVELKHHKEYDVLRGLRSFISTTPLEPYIEQIEILPSGE